MSSSQAVQASVTEVKRDQEYANFINKNRYFVDGINTYPLVKNMDGKRLMIPPDCKTVGFFLKVGPM